MLKLMVALRDILVYVYITLSWNKVEPNLEQEIDWALASAQTWLTVPDVVKAVTWNRIYEKYPDWKSFSPKKKMRLWRKCAPKVRRAVYALVLLQEKQRALLREESAFSGPWGKGGTICEFRTPSGII